MNCLVPRCYEFMREQSLDDYIILLNLKLGNDIRRFCEVRVRGNDVYAFQPRKDGSIHVSYHESGERHLKHEGGRALYTLQLDRPEWILK